MVWLGRAGLSVVAGSVSTQGFQCVRNSVRRCRVFSCFLIVSRRVSGGFRVRFIPGMCVSFSFSWKSAWVVFVCANFVRMQFSVKISARFVILPAWGSEYVLSVVSVSWIRWGVVVLVCSESMVRWVCLWSLSFQSIVQAVWFSALGFQIDLRCGAEWRRVIMRGASCPLGRFV